MIRPGLCSITFRDRSVRDVIALAVEAQLEGIEWGGDIHVPPGNPALAREVGKMTRDAGLVVSSYGSYYRAGVDSREGHSFAQVLDSAVALGAPVIRIWAGQKNEAEATPEEIQAVVEDTRRAADLARAAGVTLACEFHEGTLTERSETALRLVEKVPGVALYWQPPNGATSEAALSSLQEILPHLGNLHVFHWLVEPASGPRRLSLRSLEEGAARWQLYLQAAAARAGDRWALLEFVKDHDPAQFLRDAKTLRRLLARPILDEGSSL